MNNNHCTSRGHWYSWGMVQPKPNPSIHRGRASRGSTHPMSFVIMCFCVCCLEEGQHGHVHTQSKKELLSLVGRKKSLLLENQELLLYYIIYISLEYKNQILFINKIISNLYCLSCDLRTDEYSVYPITFPSLMQYMLLSWSHQVVCLKVGT